MSSSVDSFVEFERTPIARLSLSGQRMLDRVMQKLSFLEKSLSEGGFIAGGFVRQLLVESGENPEGRDRLFNYFQGGSANGIGGDVDVFFSNRRSCDLALDVIEPYRPKLSVTGAAHEVSSSFRVQLVTSPPDGPFAGPEETIRRFDFENVMAAVVGDEIIHSRRFHALEDKGLLHIVNGGSPFLVSRIRKYLEHRGLKSLTDKSVRHVTDWIYRLASDTHTVKPSSTRWMLDWLLQRGWLDAGEIALFLKKYPIYLSTSGEETYGGEKICVDWADNKLQTLLKNDQ